MVEVYCEMAKTYLKKKEFDEAVDLQKKALEIYQELDN
jgi:lipopolysaccharide biosynthesis regulator YciM